MAVARSLTSIALAMLLSLGALRVAAEQNGPTVDRAWARATPGAATTGAVYFRVQTAVDDRLVGLASPVAGKAELHTHVEENGMMVMHEVEGGLAIPAGQAVELKSGGALHVMLIDLRQKLVAGAMFPLTVTFEKAGAQTIMVKVERLGAKDYSDADGGDGGSRTRSGS
jgi:copper(I)-binding protein